MKTGGAIDDFQQRLADATKDIAILQTNLTTIIELVDCLCEAKAMTPDLSIRILTLAPDSAFLQARGRSLWWDGDNDSFRVESEGSLAGFLQRKRQSALDCEIRVYDEMPGFVMFKIDGDVIISFLTASGPGRQHSHVQLSEALPGVSETFVRHFDKVWERAAPLEEVS